MVAAENSYVKIREIRVEKNRIICNFDFSPDLERFFNTNLFFAEYDGNLENIDESILTIPPLATVITIAWATGADIYLENIDKNFLNSLDKIKPVFEKWFPQFSFSTRIKVKNVILNEIDSNNFTNYGLFFSSGVDSLSSFIRHIDKTPTLISIWGADVPLSEPVFWDQVKSRIENFAKENGVKNHFIKTNGREIVNDHILADEYGIKDGWWGEVSHGMFFCGICAPLTMLERIETIFIASSFSENNHKEPWGSHPSIDNEICWANTKIIHDAYELGRQEKIKYVLKENQEYLKYMRVCHSQFSKLNCGSCEKCLRTITCLVLEDIDPNQCNFDVGPSILDLIKIYIINGFIPIRIANWKNIQDNIPLDLNELKLYDSKEFFKWFSEYDFGEYQFKGDKLSLLSKTYYVSRYFGLKHLIKRVYFYAITIQI